MDTRDKGHNMRARFLLSEVGIGLRRNMTMTFAVIVTTAISLSLLDHRLPIERKAEA